jgi:hypothetical protein
MVHQLRLLWRASVITSKVPFYNAINYDQNTCSQGTLSIRLWGVFHIRIGEIMSLTTVLA